MPGAPNCQNPVWSPEELAIIGKAWDIAEAWENYRIAFGKWVYDVRIGKPGENQSSISWVKTPTRTYKAVECMWLRLHPLLHSCPNTPLERELGVVLDEMEWAL